MCTTNGADFGSVAEALRVGVAFTDYLNSSDAAELEPVALGANLHPRPQRAQLLLDHSLVFFGVPPARRGSHRHTAGPGAAGCRCTSRGRTMTSKPWPRAPR
jgi:hypothetical protein